MSPLMYLLRRSMVNTIKGMARKPLVLVGYLFMAAFVVMMIVVSFIMPSNTMGTGSVELYRAVTTAVFAVILYFSLRMGIDKGSTYFRMSDVHFLFQAPLRPNQVLVYGFLRQVGGTLLLMMIAMFQIPNLKNHFNMVSYGPLVIMLATMLYMFAYPVFSMLLYSWASKSALRRSWGKRAVDGTAGLVVVLLLLNLSQTRELTPAFVRLFDHSLMNWVPLLGWIRMVLAAAVTGISPSFWLGLGLTVLSVTTFTLWVYRMNLDYYEDVLDATAYTEAALAAKRGGTNTQFGVKVKSGVRQSMSGRGASAIFFKTMLEMRKTSLILFVDRTTVAVVAASLAFNFFTGGEGREPFVAMMSVLGFSVYMLFLFAIQGRWPQELTKPFIFMIPASSREKLLYATLPEHVKNLLDGTLLFVLAGIFFKASIPIVMTCILGYVMFGAVFLYGDVLARRLFGAVHAKAMMFFLKILLILLILVPGVVAVALVLVFLENSFLALLALSGWGMVAAVGVFMLSSGVFNNLEASG